MRLPSAFLLALGLAASLSAARADECGDTDTLLRQAYPAAIRSPDGASFTLEPHTRISVGAIEDSSPFGLTCKPWPAHDDLLLVAVPLIDSARSTDDGHFGDIEILVVGRKDLGVRQRLLQPGLLNDDAIAIRKIEFDTARYRLSPDVTAFGLRISMANQSQPNPFSETDLRLYALVASTLRVVLDGIVVSGAGGEGDTNCAGSFHSSAVSLSMGSASLHGFSDIAAVEQTDTDNPAPDATGECQSHPGKTVSKTYRLRYDGGQYPVPEPLKALAN
ncbi:hypothetical protein [Mesorhizobium shangrilense]|uniref:Uncharacterized protein n=1 Tax=Mesorhizobium shangrilense TaxID=460060 RepID=A0ABV2DET3_9HYPH